MKFRTIVADPPWTPSISKIHGFKWIRKNKASPQKYYETMSLEEICKLIPPSKDQSHLWLWVIDPHIDWGYLVARSWGFDVWKMITWCKPGLGVGRFQANTEHVLICRKGNRRGNPFGMTGGTWFQWPRGKHSEKPDEFYQLVERVSPPNYLEMFARKERDGWVVWGNEVESIINIGKTDDE